MMSFWSHPAWKQFRDANPWLELSKEAMWHASLPALYALLAVYVMWKWLEPKRMTRNTLLVSKALVPLLLTVFFVSGYLHLTVTNETIRNVMAYLFVVSLHLSAFFLMASFQPLYNERLTYENSKLNTSHYVVLTMVWFAMEYFIYACFPPLRIPLNVNREVRIYVDVVASLIILGFPVVVLRTVEDAWLCVKAPYFLYRRDNKEIGLIIKKSGVWTQNVRERPVVIQERVKKQSPVRRIPVGRAGPRRMRFRK